MLQQIILAGNHSTTSNAVVISARINSSLPRKKGHHLSDDISKCIFINEQFCISILISMKFVPNGLIDNKHWFRNWLGVEQTLSEMQTCSALLNFCEWITPVTSRSFDVFFDLRPNKRLSKQSRRRCFDTLSRSSWRHCEDYSPISLVLNNTCMAIAAAVLGTFVIRNKSYLSNNITTNTKHTPMMMMQPWSPMQWGYYLLYQAIWILTNYDWSIFHDFCRQVPD